jgi:hypothetical protein
VEGEEGKRQVKTINNNLQSAILYIPTTPGYNKNAKYLCSISARARANQSAILYIPTTLRYYKNAEYFDWLVYGDIPKNV